MVQFFSFFSSTDSVSEKDDIIIGTAGLMPVSVSEKNDVIIIIGAAGLMPVQVFLQVQSIIFIIYLCILITYIYIYQQKIRNPKIYIYIVGYVFNWSITYNVYARDIVHWIFFLTECFIFHLH